MAWNKEEDLKLKYAYVDGETDPPHKAKKKKPAPKKADHKHEYRNIIIDFKWPDNYAVSRLKGKPAMVLESYCTICGKLSSPQKDPEAAELFPTANLGHFGFLEYYGNSKVQEEYREWCIDHYSHYDMPNYYFDMYRGQTFLSLDSIIPPKCQ